MLPRSRALFGAAGLLLLAAVGVYALGGGGMSSPRFALPGSAAAAMHEPPAPAPPDLRTPDEVLVTAPRGERTVASVLETLDAPTRRRFASVCDEKGIPYPPRRVTLLAFKQEKRLEVWGAGASGPFRRLATYDVLAASGGPGPKRRQGDLQVPEGIYPLDVLNPNSRFHLSLRVAYPDGEDVANRPQPPAPLGGDIYVHGNRVSIGCLALGDAAIEEVFALVARADAGERRILIAPWDLRRRPAPPTSEPWLRARYVRLRDALAAFPAGG